ncbi:MAG: pyruvate kinase [Chloroflexota bacterium]
MRRTKIICTIGPASSSPEILRQLIREGMDVARLNFSHGDHATHARNLAAIRQIADEENRVVGILQDLQGPRIRIGSLPQSPIELMTGQEVALSSESARSQTDIIPVRGADLATDVGPGHVILIADGQIELRVLRVEGKRVIAEVVIGGLLESNKGVNVPGVTLSVPTFTEKDRADLAFGLAHGVDWVAMSFVRSAADIQELRRHIDQAGVETPIMAKIEKHEAVANFDEILAAADGIMVARGDLGIEIPAEEVPIIQKVIIDKCNRAGKPVVTATQMLNSMIENPRPTRAEASDIANAILDGTDAVMLSGETAVGKYPVESVETMARIAVSAEEAFPYGSQIDWTHEQKPLTPTEAISQASVGIADELPAAAIITLTQSGYTARQIAKYRPRTPILGITPLMTTNRRLTMVWGVQPLLADVRGNTDEMFDAAVQAGRTAGLLRANDLVVITAGVPIGGPGRTNLIKIQIA